MSDFADGGVKIGRLDALADLKAALISFQEKARLALGEAEGEVRRARVWLEADRLPHWTTQLRRRQEHLERCKEALRHKELFDSNATGRQGAVEERKAVKKAEALVAEADAKLAATRRHLRTIDRVNDELRGGLGALGARIGGPLGDTVARLEAMARHLAAYTVAAPAETTSAVTQPPEQNLVVTGPPTVTDGPVPADADQILEVVAPGDVDVDVPTDEGAGAAPAFDDLENRVT